MGQLIQLKEQISTSRNFKLLTRSYQEHAVEQISFARYSVVGSRDFSQDLIEVFYNVKTSYKRSLIKAIQKHYSNKKLSLPNKKNGKEAIVLITANDNLYGDIIPKTCKLFYQRAKTSVPDRTDLIIIGRRGKDFIDQQNLPQKYQYMELPDTKITLEYLKPIAQKLITYQSVIVFYGKFNNILSQDAIQGYISGDLPQEKEGQTSKEDFLFEPSIEDILSFFETQIFSILLNQVVQEGQLARFASRINAMEQAQNNIQKELNILKNKQKLIKIMELNKKQLELLSGRALWNK